MNNRSKLVKISDFRNENLLNAMIPKISTQQGNDSPEPPKFFQLQNPN